MLIFFFWGARPPLGRAAVVRAPFSQFTLDFGLCLLGGLWSLVGRRLGWTSISPDVRRREQCTK